MKLKKLLLSLSSFIVIALLINISYSQKPVYAGNNPTTTISANSADSEPEPTVSTKDNKEHPAKKTVTTNKPAKNTVKPAAKNNNVTKSSKTTHIPGYVP